MTKKRSKIKSPKKSKSPKKDVKKRSKKSKTSKSKSPKKSPKISPKISQKNNHNHGCKIKTNELIIPEQEECEYINENYLKNDFNKVTNLLWNYNLEIKENESLKSKCKKIFFIINEKNKQWLTDCTNYLRKLQNFQKEALACFINGAINFSVNQAKIIDDLVRNAPPTYNQMSLFRGLKLHNFDKNNINKLSIKNLFYYPFVSFNLWINIAAEFATSNDPNVTEVIIQMIIPKGSNCLYVDKMNALQEQEVLLPVTDFEIIYIEHNYPVKCKDVTQKGIIDIRNFLMIIITPA